MAHHDYDKIAEFAEENAWAALESMMLRGADFRNPQDRQAAKDCLKIICMASEDLPEQSQSMGSYDDGMGGQSMAGRSGRHLVRAHYSYADNGSSYGNQYGNSHTNGSYNSRAEGSTLSRMMDMATPQEQQVLERLLRKADA